MARKPVLPAADALTSVRRETGRDKRVQVPANCAARLTGRPAAPRCRP